MRQTLLTDEHDVPLNEKASETTPGGYSFDEVSSALQKSIRRGLEEDALYWCAEFYRTKPENLWKRLRVIASEDVGLASPAAALTVRSLYENWRDFVNEKWDGKDLFVIHAVLTLVRAKKSRMVDHATNAAFGFAANGHTSLLDRHDIPDYGADKHTQRGRMMGRGFKHFFAHGAHLENRADIPDAYEARIRAALEKVS
jgi:replication-associated recombination protein RarA